MTGLRKHAASVGPIVLACAVVLTYNLLYTNGFYPITEGWFSEYGRLIREGAIPYRDFSLLLTPLYPFLIAAFQAIFGESFFALHVMGAAIMCAFCAALFDITKNFVDRWIAALAAAAGTIYYESGVAFISYDFTQFLNLFALLAAAMGMRAIRARSGSATVGFSAATGFCCSLAFLTKQSNGAAIAATLIFAMVVALVLQKRRIAIGGGAAAVAGLLVPIAVVACALAAAHALGPAVQQIVDVAAGVKGKSAVFYAWFPRIVGEPSFILRGIGAVVVVLAIFGLSWSVVAIVEMARAKTAAGSWSWRESLSAILRGATSARGSATAYAAIVGCVAVFSLTWLSAFGMCGACAAFRPLSRATIDGAVPLALTVYVFLIVATVWSLWYRSAARGDMLVLAALGTGLIVGNGTSGGMSQVSGFLAMTLLLAILLQAYGRYAISLIVPIATVIAFTGIFIDAKFLQPYAWWGVVVPPVRLQHCAPVTGVLAGLCISNGEWQKIDRIAKDIERVAPDGDAMYAYPHVPLFYLMTKRHPFENMVQTWFDFADPSWVARTARALRAAPPSAVVVAELPDWVMSQHENLFNRSQPLAQRAMLSSITSLVNEKRLLLADRITDLDGVAVDVYSNAEATASLPRSTGPTAGSSPVAVPADFWPEYQFDAANTGVFEAPDLHVRWSADIGDHTNSGLAIVGNVLYVTSFDHATYALDLETGRQIWRTELHNVTMSTPIITSGIVIVGTGDGTIAFHEDDQLMTAGYAGDALYGLNASTGAIEWIFPTKGEDMASGAVVTNRRGNEVYVFSGGDQHVYGIDPESGRELWSRYVPGGDFMTSLAASNGVVYGTTGYSWDYFYRGWRSGDESTMWNENHTWAIDADGNFVWQSLTGQPTNSFAVADGMILAETIRENPAVNPKAATRDEMLAAQGDVVQGIDQKTGELRWEFDDGGFGGQTHDGSNIETAGGLARNGVLYQAMPLSNDFVALEDRTGRKLWSIRTGAPVKMPAVMVGDALYFGDTSGKFYVVDALTGRVVSMKRFKGKFGASPPLVVGHTLFVANGKKIFALDIDDLRRERTGETAAKAP